MKERGRKSSDKRSESLNSETDSPESGKESEAFSKATAMKLLHIEDNDCDIQDINEALR